jgi:hypothetical protein
MYQSLVEGRTVPWDLLVKDVPPEHHHDLDYLLDMLDWDANTDPEFYKHRHFEPAPVAPLDFMADAGVLRKVDRLLHASTTPPRNSPSSPAVPSPSATLPPMD